MPGENSRHRWRNCGHPGTEQSTLEALIGTVRTFSSNHTVPDIDKGRGQAPSVVVRCEYGDLYVI